MKAKVMRLGSTATVMGNLRSSSSLTGKWPSDVMSIPEFYSAFVPEYKSQNYGPRIFVLEWNRGYARRIEGISAKRSSSRVSNYLVSEEIVRVENKLAKKGEASIRFGNLKSGHGYSGERGDFCLVAGIVKKRELTVYYRSLELIGGFAFDLTLFWNLERELLCDFRKITLVTNKAFIFALKGNSNEKLYPKLCNIFSDRLRG